MSETLDEAWQLKASHFRGCARVRLDNLRIDPDNTLPIDHKNVERLVEVFGREDCQRGEPENHVQVLIEPDLLQRALAASSLLPQDLHELGRIEDLQLDTDEVVVLQGRHRLLAAKKVLFNTDRWWIADLYDTGKLNGSPGRVSLTADVDSLA